MTPIGSFTYYYSAPDLILFTCWNADQSSLGVHSVYPDGLARNIQALEAMGYVNRNARGEYYDYRRREWVAK
jgi:hypothetical protein